jgi:predicted ATPase/DNA-binding XRE family transcriptional regulator
VEDSRKVALEGGPQQRTLFGALLRRHRLAAGLTQDALAERARLSVRAVADLERGARRHPYAETVERLATALGLADDVRAALATAGRRLPTPPHVAHLLPHARQLTSFVGRETEIEELRAVASEARLLTLIGPPGVGKTRLAMEVANRLSETEFDSWYFVDLAPIHDPSLVETAVIACLGGRQMADTAPVATIARLLAGRRSLLLVDNCEHLVQSVSRLVDTILRQTPDTWVIATSREPLDIVGEARWGVPPLNERDGIRLFIERARLIDSRFVSRGKTEAAVAQLCRKLDGLPLAIELAAARVGQLPVEDILAHLEEPFAFLRRGGRTTEPRHQTLEAAISWSHDLLDDDERAAFACLSVFAGGFDPAAAQQVAQCSFEVLGRLVDKSMMIAGTGVDGRARYRLLETMREYAHTRLDESGATAVTRRRHFEYFAAFARDAFRELQGPHQGAWVDRLHQELDNFRAALDWGAAEDADAALAMAVNLTRFWARSQPLEGRWRLQHLLSITPDASAELRAAARTTAADFAADIGRPDKGRMELEQVLQEWRELCNPTGIARTLVLLAQTGTGTTVLAERRALLEEAVAQARHSSDAPVLSEALIFLGVATSSSGDRVPARVYLQEAVSTARSVGDLRTLALALELLGHLDEIERRFGDARTCHDEALRLAVEAREPRLQTHAHIHLGLVSLAQAQDQDALSHFGAALAIRQVGYHQCGAILGLARLAARGGRFERALRLHGAASLNDWDTVLYRTKLADLEKQPWIRVARRTLGRDSVAVAWSAGAAMTPEEAIAYALSEADDPLV